MNARKNMAVCVVFSLILAGGSILCIFWPKEAYSDSERRYLAPAPKFSAYTAWSGRFMSDFEAYAADAFPFRNSFRTLKALTAAGIFGKWDNNGIYAADGFLAKVEYPLNSASLDRAAGRFRYIRNKYLTEENKIYLSVIPDKNCFLAKESGHLSLDYADFEKRMADSCDFAEDIPLSDLLEKDDYYKTDTHWRQERIVDAANRILRTMGAAEGENYDKRLLNQDFYGVYYGQAALPHTPDQLYYLTGESIDGCTVYDWQNKKEGSVYDMERAAGKDPYELFLSGTLSLVTIENPNAPQEKKLVMFRDSFGSSIAPLLAGGYSQITLVDIRYIHPDVLGQFIDFGASDVLFLYSTLVLNHSDTLK